MKQRNDSVVACLFLALALVLGGCGDDDGPKGDYQGVGKLVADRNEARLASASARKGQDGAPGTEAEPGKKPARSTEVIIEEEVTIVSRVSGKTIATATAFLDKSGKIINIRVKRD
jgi:hypothetical protein